MIAISYPECSGVMVFCGLCGWWVCRVGVIRKLFTYREIEMPLISWHRLAPAVAADRALLTACFLGRLVRPSRLRWRG